MSAPPSYQEVDASAAPADDVADLFANLRIDPSPHNPDPDTCLAHLRLLFAFQNLKEDVGYTDGLWGIWDSRADGNMVVADNGEVEERPGAEGDRPDDVEEKHKALSKIREKRWALFVARAVDRYEAWWNSLTGERALRESDLDDEKSVAYDLFPVTDESSYWEKQSLPPLDVLMVFHAHLLNPYNFLEDCLRKGYRRFWQSGFPWHLVNAAIDASFNYNVSDDDKARWISQTGRSWDNVDHSLVKSLNCPVCSEPLEIPWTTCGLDEKPKTWDRPGLIGSGYGDGKLEFQCVKCATHITKELLSVAKFCRDSRNLLVKSYPMPGTILEPSTGKPEPWKRSVRQPWNFRTFPNRMIHLVLRIQIQELLSLPFPDNAPPTMETVRKMIEDKVMMNQVSRRTVYMGTANFKTMRRTGVAPVSRVCVRKMMSRYWENFSPFALDLCGAVMRQGIFSEKMCRIDWLHSPAARETMTRLCTKYERFMSIMAGHPTKVSVPTLDIDLAWHTHQLSPRAYYEHTVRETGKYIRHDDKIEECKLGEGFEWTSKVYQETYGEVYSECTCWYCESVRASHISSVSKVFKMSKSEKVADKFYDSGAANLCPPDNSAHISSHNAVRAPDPDVPAHLAKKIQGRLRDMHERRLEENYQKACKRAEKKGRKLPPKKQYYDHWGYSYYTAEDPWLLGDAVLWEDALALPAVDGEVVEGEAVEGEAVEGEEDVVGEAAVAAAEGEEGRDDVMM
ncbi:hypothetical protein ACJ41O_001724 [Fusarium nematophilum]